jgi:choline dehydrogenase-like flavoprotein
VSTSFARAALPHGLYTRHDWPHLPGARVRRRAFRTDVVELTCDVVIVGSGAGGGVMAAELAEGGLDVLVVEEGGYHPTEEFTAEPGPMIRKLYRDGGAQMALGTPPVTFAEGRCVGGSTVINGGMSWRTPATILERWYNDDWVERIGPAEMEPYFDRVERFIHMGPQDEGTVGRDNELLRQGAEARDWKVIPNTRNQLHCGGTNNCAFGCPTGAKRSTLVSYLPRALSFGARVLSDCKVDRVLHRQGRATGVRGRMLNSDGSAGYRFVVRARRTVMSAGAVQTPTLLLRSGVRSPSGRLGHNLSLHPNTKVVALFDEQVEGWKGVHQAYQVREFERQGYLFAAVNIPPSIVAMTLPFYGAELARIMDDYPRALVAGILVEDTLTGRVRSVGGVPVPTYQLSAEDGRRLVRGTALLCQLLFSAGARRIVLPFEGVPDLTCMEDADRLLETEIPMAHMEVVTVHIMGTAAMGGDPARHVCDSYGRVQGAQGLYISDASLFPSPIGVNPMETIMALSTRNAERILQGH